MMRTIKVTGKGKIAVKPDKIRLYVNKEELCKEYEDTLRRSTEDTELLKDLFEKLGFQRKDLKTVYFNVDTEYESYQDRDKSWKRRFKGYKYNHHMKIEFAADNKRLGQVLYALAHSSLRPEFSIEYTVADVEKCKNELLHKAIEDSIQKAQVLTTAANVKLGEIQAIDYSWGEIDFVTKPLNETC
ncbi:SIMPL domain-containing protein [Dorea longicatena]|uniref:SIMPL domain-containing protein n=1 Tax=Dorea longicatena TaxID=88431 RepID=UPI00321A2FFD